MTYHQNTALHWAPEPVEESPYTACGRNIDGPCDKHERMRFACRNGVSWTRGRDLAAYQGRPAEPQWPPPCPVCEQAASADTGSRTMAR